MGWDKRQHEHDSAHLDWDEDAFCNGLLGATHPMSQHLEVQCWNACFSLSYKAGSSQGECSNTHLARDKDALGNELPRDDPHSVPAPQM